MSAVGAVKVAQSEHAYFAADSIALRCTWRFDATVVRPERVGRENPAVLVADPGKELRGFRVACTSNLGSKRGRGRGAFIDSILTAVDGFYAEVLGSLRPWSAAPPKLRPGHPSPPSVEATVPAALVSADYSSQDGTPSEVAAPEGVGPAFAVEPG